MINYKKKFNVQSKVRQLNQQNTHKFTINMYKDDVFCELFEKSNFFMPIHGTSMWWEQLQHHLTYSIWMNAFINRKSSSFSSDELMRFVFFLSLFCPFHAVFLFPCCKCQFRIDRSQQKFNVIWKTFKLCFIFMFESNEIAFRCFFLVHFTFGNIIYCRWLCKRSRLKFRLSSLMFMLNAKRILSYKVHTFI